MLPVSAPTATIESNPDHESPTHLGVFARCLRLPGRTAARDDRMGLVSKPKLAGERLTLMNGWNARIPDMGRTARHDAVGSHAIRAPNYVQVMTIALSVVAVCLSGAVAVVQIATFSRNKWRVTVLLNGASYADGDGEVAYAEIRVSSHGRTATVRSVHLCWLPSEYSAVPKTWGDAEFPTRLKPPLQPHQRFVDFIVEPTATLVGDGEERVFRRVLEAAGGPEPPAIYVAKVQAEVAVAGIKKPLMSISTVLRVMPPGVTR
jgi:hypothetical protein